MSAHPIPEEKVKGIRKARWAGASLFEISCDFDVDESTVSRYTADIPVRARSGRPAGHNYGKVLHLLDQGVPTAIIKERLGISLTHIFRICRCHRGMTPAQLRAHLREKQREAA